MSQTVTAMGVDTCEVFSFLRKIQLLNRMNLSDTPHYAALVSPFAAMQRESRTRCTSENLYDNQPL
jgi:hypothetical protein